MSGLVYLCQRERLLAFMLVFGLLLTTDAQNQPPPVQANAAGGGPGQQVQPPAPIVHKRFEYKYSFKPPYLAQKDGTVPFFEYSGSKFQVNFAVLLDLS